MTSCIAFSNTAIHGNCHANCHRPSATHIRHRRRVRAELPSLDDHRRTERNNGAGRSKKTGQGEQTGTLSSGLGNPDDAAWQTVRYLGQWPEEDLQSAEDTVPLAGILGEAAIWQTRKGNASSRIGRADSPRGDRHADAA